MSSRKNGRGKTQRKMWMKRLIVYAHGMQAASQSSTISFPWIFGYPGKKRKGNEKSRINKPLLPDFTYRPTTNKQNETKHSTT